ncbi:MAG TPA: C25 family cysteine peptidase, partial [Anaerolineae bacterium]|nr:C25 family cysteine peptidase [Anaerolineae bacterium]
HALHIDHSSASFMAVPDHRYLVIGPKGYTAAHITRAATDPDLRASAGADYIAIGPPDLLTPLQPLLDWHTSQNLKTITVPVEAIYDQFSDGRVEPEAIRAFLKYAVANWKTAPKYVLLVGDSTYDPLGYSAPPDGNRLPAFFVQTSYGGETASDVMFVQLHDDSQLPDVAIGRVPARTADQVRVWVDKTLTYSRSAPGGDWRQRVLAVADGQEAVFADDAKTFLDSFPQKYQGTFLTPMANVPGANQQVLAKFSDGNFLVAYFGHGSVTQWGKDNLFTVNDVKSTSNGDRLPIVLNMTCLTGLFTHPKVQSLAETLLWKQGGGAVAVLAPTSLTLSDDQGFLSRALVTSYLASTNKPLGDLLLSAWRQIPLDGAGTLDVLRTFLLFGDPALKIVGP